jgi:hypothetical protein
MRGAGRSRIVQSRRCRAFRLALGFVGLALGTVLAPVSCAQAEGLTLSVSTPRVEIRSNFSGVDLVLFGGIQVDPGQLFHPRYDIAITVRGPSAPLDVRQKARTAAIWINSGRQRFADVPSFLALASSRPLGEVAKLVNIGVLSAFIVICAAVLLLRRRKPELPRAFRTPWVPLIPLVGIGFSIWLLSELAVITWMVFLGWVGLGLLVYFAYGMRHSKLAAQR